MHTYHIHIGGRVQGVGFRPYIRRLADKKKLHGWVNNGNDGLHIEINASETIAQQFLREILTHAPANAIIDSHSIKKLGHKNFHCFQITASTNNTEPDLLLTPDIGICNDCINDICHHAGRRYHYPFTTCLECGPRYSIINALPYDREHTSMANLQVCPNCRAEYNNINDRRHYSQTNSCIHCSIPIALFNDEGEKITADTNLVLEFVHDELKAGKTIAVKGIGGYLLLCDAGNDTAIRNLRERKHRPAKPLAVLYPAIELAHKDVHINKQEEEALQSKVSPIVLCRLRQNHSRSLQAGIISPGLNKIGVMLPYTGLLYLISKKFGKALIATSGNLSGSPIVYEDDEALTGLCNYADYVLAYERDIVTPQDDSVMQFTEYGRQIILRRSRGMAPEFYPNPFAGSADAVIALGAELKSCFTILNKNNLYISQYLGRQDSYEAQQSYRNTLQHMVRLLHVKPSSVLVDSHPQYHVTDFGKKLAAESALELKEIQHHAAHFCAVLQESDLFDITEPVLGVIWDGTGYGNDGQIWGGEFFTYQRGKMERTAHLEYFPQFLGDKMSREPRVSAVSLLRNNMEQLMMLKEQFVAKERMFYLKLIEHDNAIQTSSMGRLLDGIASILGICPVNSFEGEAAMKLEAMAEKCSEKTGHYYELTLQNDIISWHGMVTRVMDDKNAGIPIPFIAKKVFASLANLIGLVAEARKIKKIACSGGVFQNALLVDLIDELLGCRFEMYFQHKLSPNDENISFGQLAYVRNNVNLLPAKKELQNALDNFMK
ncbi:MAG: carbamoyltransferase HypF [Ferruginibacter sp.]